MGAHSQNVVSMYSIYLDSIFLPGHLSQLPNLLRDTRFSCGIGLHCRLGVAQIEINYAVPLRAKSNDRYDNYDVIVMSLRFSYCLG